MNWNNNAWNRLRYTFWAPGYDFFVARLFRARRRKAVRLLDIQPGERVLLVGAGTGLDLDALGESAECSIVATDLTPAMLEKLRKRAARLELPVEAVVMDGQAVDFPAESFDVVLLHLILAVIPDPVRCAQEAARVLKPGGRVSVLDKFLPSGQSPPWWLRLVKPLASLLATEIDRSLEPILAAAGLTAYHDEAVGLGGLFRIVLARKGA